MWTLPLFSSLMSLGFVATLVMAAPDPISTAAVSDTVPARVVERAEVQSLTVAEGFVNKVTHDKFEVEELVVEPIMPAAPAAGAPDPGTAQAIALSMLTARGMGTDQYNCLVSLWNRESGWNVYAHNASSGAYGIPQSLPGNKMASAGADWATNPTTQITWGLGYIQGRYGTPCGAWAHSESNGWY